MVNNAWGKVAVGVLLVGIVLLGYGGFCGLGDSSSSSSTTGSSVTVTATGTVNGVIRNAITGTGMANVTVQFYNQTNTTLIGTYITDVNGAYTATLTAGVYTMRVLATGYVSEMVSSLTVQGNTETTVDPVQQVPTSVVTTGTVTGIIKDAFTGFGVTGAALSFRLGINANTGTVVMTATTTSGGYYTVTSLPAGNYTVQATLTNYTDLFFTATSLGGQTNANQNASITPAANTTTVTGTVNSVIRNAVTGAVIPNVTINVYTQTGALAGTYLTDANGVYTASLTAGIYNIRVVVTGYINDLISGVHIQGNLVTTVEPVQQVPTSVVTTGIVTGIIKDAFTGLGMTGVALKFRSGINASAGTVVTATTTTSGGVYTVTSLPAGNYTVQATLANYLDLFFTATCIGGTTNDNQNATITPVLPVGQTRIVLTWGDTPYDLDSHTTGPITQTTTNTYKYFVHDYSNKYSTTSNIMGASGAQVKVYRGNSMIAAYNVPNQIGTLWTVFELTGGTITPINTMTFESDSSIIGATTSDRFHVYYGARGSSDASPYTELDVDDTSSYGPETTTIQTGSSVVVATGIATGVVRNATTDAVIPNVTINAYTLAGVLAGTYLTDANGAYTSTLAAGVYNINAVYTGYITGVVSNVTITENIVTTLEPVQLTQVSTTPGTVTGVIKDAFTGVGISGVALSFRSGINATTGTVALATTTTSGGAYTASNLAAGNYTVEAVLTNYTTMFFTVICIGGTTNANQNASITPVLPAGQTRIVLTWGDTPYDLDSHMTVPTTTAITTRPHVYYSSRGGDLTTEPYVNLDVDDTSSYGPETVTIYVQRSGVYRYSIHDFSNRYLTTSSVMGASGAQVKVYRGSSLIATFNVPNQVGTLWTVFELSDNTVTPINTMTSESDPANVRRITSPVSDNDGPLMLNLPAK